MRHFDVRFDLETRSDLDLGAIGTWNYSRGENTKVLCLAYDVELIENGNVSRSYEGFWVPPEVLLPYVFNASASLKSLMGHWHAVKGKEKRIGKKKMEEIRAGRTDYISEDYGLNQTEEATPVRYIAKGFKFEGFLHKPKWLTKLKYEPRPKVLCDVLTGNIPYTLEAHNVFFEKCLYWHKLQPLYGFPAVPIDNWSCSAALAAAHSLPRSLEGVSTTLGLPVQKDLEGKAVMQQMARPIKRDGEIVGYYNDPFRFTKLFDYCVDDVRTEKEIGKRLGSLPEREITVWKLNQKVNTKGVPLDPDTVNGAIKIIESYTEVLEKELFDLSGGRLENIRQNERLKLFLEENGILTDSVDKAAVEGILERKNIPDVVRKVLETRQKLGQTSTAKYFKMREQLAEDGTIKDQYMYHGAISGRETGKGVQVSNLPRGNLKQTNEMLEDIRLGSWRNLLAHGDPMDVLSSCLRGVVTAPPGKKFLVSDYSNIEGRITAWLAGEEWKLDAFRKFDQGQGPDIYKLTYAMTFNKDVDAVTPDERQVGKSEELGLNFSGWVGAFHTMAKVYGVSIPDDEAKDLIIKWRAKHPKLVRLWDDLEKAAKECIITKDPQIVNDKISFEMRGDFLCNVLPSGKAVHYYKPLLRDQVTPWGETKQSISYLATKMGKTFRNDIWRGTLIENSAQAIAREILVEAMLRVDATDPYDIRMSTYDEILALVPDEPKYDTHTFDNLLAVRPEWCQDLPIACEGFECKHYSKN